MDELINPSRQQNAALKRTLRALITAIDSDDEARLRDAVRIARIALIGKRGGPRKRYPVATKEHAKALIAKVGCSAAAMALNIPLGTIEKWAYSN